MSLVMFLRKSNLCFNKVRYYYAADDIRVVGVDFAPVIVHENDDQLFYIGGSETGDWAVSDPKGHKVWSAKVNNDTWHKIPGAELLKETFTNDLSIFNSQMFVNAMHCQHSLWLM